MNDNIGRKKSCFNLWIGNLIYFLLTPVKAVIFLGKQMFFATHYTARTITKKQNMELNLKPFYINVSNNFRNGFGEDKKILTYNFKAYYIKKWTKKK